MAKGPLSAHVPRLVARRRRRRARSASPHVELENAGSVDLARRRSASPTTGSTTAATPSSGTASARRSRSSRPGERVDRAGARPGADPPGPLPLRARPRRRASRLVRGARRGAASRAEVEVAPRRGDGAARAARLRRRRAPEFARRVAAAHAEGYASSPARSPGPRGSAARGRARSRLRPRPRPHPELPPPAPLPLACSTASSSSGSPTSPGCRRSRRPRDEPWIYDGRDRPPRATRR